jgi:hypothetical protein
MKQARPVPTIGRPVHRGSPLDYGPVLLLMPFGFHLAADTLPSEDSTLLSNALLSALHPSLRPGGAPALRDHRILYSTNWFIFIALGDSRFTLFQPVTAECCQCVIRAALLSRFFFVQRVCPCKSSDASVRKPASYPKLSQQPAGRVELPARRTGGFFFGLDPSHHPPRNVRKSVFPPRRCPSKVLTQVSGSLNLLRRGGI